MRPILILLTIMLVLSSTRAQATGSAVFSTEEGAIQGYDPVAYFKENAAVKGKEDIVYQWREATWHFSSTENRDLFRENPEAYAPAFGGYCAFSMGEGLLVPSEPQVFSIRDGVLYLNLSEAVRQTWLEDVTGNVTQALENWLSIGKQ